MTTENLIELAKYCTKRNFNRYASCKDCPYDNNVLCQDMLLSDVTERLQKAYESLKDQSRCYTCSRNDCEAVRNFYYSEYCDIGEWKWEGDEE